MLALLLTAGAVYAALIGQNAHSNARYLDVDPAEGTVSANETVAFEDLSPAQQEQFERARNSTEIIEIPAGLDADAFIDNRYVRYQNRTYDVAVAVP